MSRVFLTGGTGFLGSRVCRALRRRGDSVVLLDRSGSAGKRLQSAEHDGIEIVAADLLGGPRYRDALAAADVVLHLAALTGRASKQEHFRVNAMGTETLVDECRRAGVQRILFASTIAVKFPDKERYYYAQAKVRAEEAVRGSRLTFTIIRPTIILGPGSAILTALQRLASFPLIPVFGSGRAMVQPIFVDDLVEFIMTILDENRFCGETLEFGGPAALTIEELLQKIRLARTGNRGHPIHIPLGLLLGPLKAAEAIGLGGVLPVSVGQLCSFRYDGTIESNGLFENRRATLRDVPQMLALSLAA
jgi:nucleoside-diphosphate-sugar epimerase